MLITKIRKPYNIANGVYLCVFFNIEPTLLPHGVYAHHLRPIKKGAISIPLVHKLHLIEASIAFVLHATTCGMHTQNVETIIQHDATKKSSGSIFYCNSCIPSENTFLCNPLLRIHTNNIINYAFISKYISFVIVY